MGSELIIFLIGIVVGILLTALVMTIIGIYDNIKF